MGYSNKTVSDRDTDSIRQWMQRPSNKDCVWFMAQGIRFDTNVFWQRQLCYAEKCFISKYPQLNLISGQLLAMHFKVVRETHIVHIHWVKSSLLSLKIVPSVTIPPAFSCWLGLIAFHQKVSKYSLSFSEKFDKENLLNLIHWMCAESTKWLQRTMCRFVNSNGDGHPRFHLIVNVLKSQHTFAPNNNTCFARPYSHRIMFAFLFCLTNKSQQLNLPLRLQQNKRLWFRQQLLQWIYSHPQKWCQINKVCQQKALIVGFVLMLSGYFKFVNSAGWTIYEKWQTRAVFRLNSCFDSWFSGWRSWSHNPTSDLHCCIGVEVSAKVRNLTGWQISVHANPTCTRSEYFFHQNQEYRTNISSSPVFFWTRMHLFSGMALLPETASKVPALATHEGSSQLTFKQLHFFPATTHIISHCCMFPVLFSHWNKSQ